MTEKAVFAGTHHPAIMLNGHPAEDAVDLATTAIDACARGKVLRMPASGLLRVG
jgi:hypothetical protein